jgi:hypothetical protein
VSAARQAVRAAPGVAASMPLEAFAHGGAVPGWVAWPLLVAFLGVIACLVVPFLAKAGQSGIGRGAVGLLLAAFAFLTWLGLLWIFARNAGDPSISQWLGAIVWAGLTLYTWIVAAAYAVAVWAGRRRRSP